MRKKRERFFFMKSLRVKADLESLEEVLAFVNGQLSSLGCTEKTRMQIEIAVEEIFVNISSYAYSADGPGSGDRCADISVRECEDRRSVVVTISDNGIPFDPLAREDPDVTLSADRRKIGGLGIYMVKKSMDHVQYEYRDGQNILTFRKDLF